MGQLSFCRLACFPKAYICLLLPVCSRLFPLGRGQVRTRDDVLTCARHMHSDALAPIFLTSSVTVTAPSRPPALQLVTMLPCGALQRPFKPPRWHRAALENDLFLVRSQVRFVVSHL